MFASAKKAIYGDGNGDQLELNAYMLAPAPI